MGGIYFLPKLMVMKNILGSLVICCLLIFNSALANTVIVKGTVQDANKKPIANKKITIATDSLNSTTGCFITHTVLTNPNGYYLDTLKCLGGDIRKLKISVENCNGTLLINDPSVGLNSTVESNFVLCIPNSPVPTNCNAQIAFNVIGKSVKFNSVSSTATGIGDSIISRSWFFGDSSSIISGNRIDPTHDYAKTGSYQACLYIKTKAGCESKYCVSFNIKDTVFIPTTCKAFFSYSIKDSLVNFNSEKSAGANSTDSIIRRTWFYVQGSTQVQLPLNVVNPMVLFPKPGTYQVYLTIATKSGCESKYAVTIQIPNSPCAVQVQFSAERTGPKKVQFNSSLSMAANDSIVSRTWKFGDNTILSGNQVKPLKEYPIQGAYTVCLKVKTANGCEAELCKPVILQDSINLPQVPNDFIRIVSINPNPVAYRMILTIWSRNHQTDTEVSIYDIYGQLKKTLAKQLIQGNNVLEINTESLPKGPYYLKVSCKNGKDSRSFYKL